MADEKDGVVPGLIVRFAKTPGKDAYYLRCRINNRPRHIRLGNTLSLTRVEARRLARARRRELDLGDGLRLIEPPPPTTMEDAYQLAVREHWSAARYLDSGWAREVEFLYKNHIAPGFGAAMEIAKIKAPEIMEWHRRIATTRLVTANRAMSVLSKIYAIAIRRELCTMNPCASVTLPQEPKRSRFASPDEIKKILSRLHAEMPTNPRQSIFILTLLYTGARPQSLERARWDQVEMQGDFGVLKFHGKSSSDSGEKEEIILPPNVLAWLKNLNAGEFLFNMRTPHVFWRKIAAEVGCPDLWARDLRRTFATVALSNGMPLDQIGRMLNHKSAQTTLRYAKLMPHSKIDFAEKITKLMDDQT